MKPYQALVNEEVQVEVTPALVAKLDVAELPQQQMHIISGGKSYRVALDAIDPSDKLLVIRVNGKAYEVKISDEHDRRQFTLGLGNISAQSKAQSVKAPMPGTVLSIAVGVGDAVKKGDVLLILEAMKMENVLKSPITGKVTRVVAVVGKSVEKAELLVELSD